MSFEVREKLVFLLCSLSITYSINLNLIIIFYVLSSDLHVIT